jgi:anhydro-N-acetylmuramic acid kinase
MEVQELIAAGGGVHNPVLMGHLAQYLPGVKLRTVDEFGVSSDAKEAVAFAVLAAETWRKRPSNVPSATGARRPVILGKISY